MLADLEAITLFIKGYMLLIKLNIMLKNKGLKATKDYFVGQKLKKEIKFKYIVLEDIERIVNSIITLSMHDSVCLEKSFLLYYLLQSHGYKESILYIGIRNMQFEAHAWVEYKGDIIGENIYYINNFVPIYNSRMR